MQIRLDSKERAHYEALAAERGLTLAQWVSRALHAQALREAAGDAGSLAAALGARGGSARSPAKTAAVRANGAKGGRPRKTKGAEERT